MDTIQTIGVIAKLGYLGLQLTRDLAQLTQWIAGKVAARTSQTIHNVDNLQRIEEAINQAAEGMGKTGDQILVEEVGKNFEEGSGRFFNKSGRWAGNIHWA